MPQALAIAVAGMPLKSLVTGKTPPGRILCWQNSLDKKTFHDHLTTRKCKCSKNHIGTCKYSKKSQGGQKRGNTNTTIEWGKTDTKILFCPLMLC